MLFPIRTMITCVHLGLVPRHKKGGNIRDVSFASTALLKRGASILSHGSQFAFNITVRYGGHKQLLIRVRGTKNLELFRGSFWAVWEVKDPKSKIQRPWRKMRPAVVTGGDSRSFASVCNATIPQPLLSVFWTTSIRFRLDMGTDSAQHCGAPYQSQT
jgi:hypothetical protein